MGNKVEEMMGKLKSIPNIMMVENTRAFNKCLENGDSYGVDKKGVYIWYIENCSPLVVLSISWSKTPEKLTYKMLSEMGTYMVLSGFSLSSLNSIFDNLGIPRDTRINLISHDMGCYLFSEMSRNEKLKIFDVYLKGTHAEKDDNK